MLAATLVDAFRCTAAGSGTSAMGYCCAMFVALVATASVLTDGSVGCIGRGFSSTGYTIGVGAGATGSATCSVCWIGCASTSSR